MDILLPDLRATIAEGMEALGQRGYIPNDSAQRGADTLRWCAAREAPSVEELLAQIELLEDIIEAVDEAAQPSSLSAAKRLVEIRNLVA
jgi:hypothetical protein